MRLAYQCRTASRGCISQLAHLMEAVFAETHSTRRALLRRLQALRVRVRQHRPRKVLLLLFTTKKARNGRRFCLLLLYPTFLSSQSKPTQISTSACHLKEVCSPKSCLITLVPQLFLDRPSIFVHCELHSPILDVEQSHCASKKGHA